MVMVTGKEIRGLQELEFGTDVVEFGTDAIEFGMLSIEMNFISTCLLESMLVGI